MRAAAPDALALRWHVGIMGCLFAVLLAGAVLFGVAVFEPSLAAELAGQRRAGFIRAGQSGSINWIAAALALVALGAAAKTGWRWSDMTAVRADDSGLAFHRSVGRPKLSWKDVRAVGYVPLRATGMLRVETAAGDVFAIRQVDPARGAAFARAVNERWLRVPHAAPRM